MNPSDEWRLATSHIGKRVLIFDQLDSTNSYALSLVHDESNDGLVIVADEQTSGRGQQGRAWSCPRDGGVLLSVLVLPPPQMRRPAILTAWASVSVCELIEKSTGLEATIKWPNDVLVAGLKVCGVLIEQAQGTVAGIGLNVNQPAEHFAAAGLPNAASLAMLIGQQRLCRDVARALILELDAQYEGLKKGDASQLQMNWMRRIGLVGEQVEAETATGTHRGLLRELSFDKLELRTEHETMPCFLPESVRQLRVVGISS